MKRILIIGVCFFFAIASQSGQAVVVGPETTIHVVTDVLDAQIGLRGGTLSDLLLRKYSASLRQKDKPFVLMEHTRENVFTAQSGLIGTGDAPTHHAEYVAEAKDYALKDGVDTLEVPLKWEGEQLTVTKTYRFKRGSYLVEVLHEVENKSDLSWSGRMYGQFRRTAPNEPDPNNVYTGGVLSGPEIPYQKVSFDDMKRANLDRIIQGGWVAMIQHYFIGAWIPPQEDPARYYSKALNEGQFVLGVVGGKVEVPPQSAQTLGLKLYAGPKIREQLKAAAPRLELTFDYLFFFIAQPISLALHSIFRVIGNWGLSLIIFTLLTISPFYFLTIQLYRRRTKAIIAAINDSREPTEDGVELARKFRDQWQSKENRRALNWRGFPIWWVVFPMFTIATYWVLLETVELRHTPLTPWWNDLSGPDPTWTLPVVYLFTILLPDLVFVRHHRWMRRWWIWGLVFFSLGFGSLITYPLAVTIFWTLFGALRMFFILRLTRNMGTDIGTRLGIDGRVALSMLAQK